MKELTPLISVFKRTGIYLAESHSLIFPVSSWRVRYRLYRLNAHNQRLRVTAFPGQCARQMPRSHMDTSHARRRTCRRPWAKMATGSTFICHWDLWNAQSEGETSRGNQWHIVSMQMHDYHYCRACMSSYIYIYVCIYYMYIYTYVYLIINIQYVHTPERIVSSSSTRLPSQHFRLTSTHSKNSSASFGLRLFWEVGLGTKVAPLTKHLDSCWWLRSKESTWRLKVIVSPCLIFVNLYHLLVSSNRSLNHVSWIKNWGIQPLEPCRITWLIWIKPLASASRLLPETGVANKKTS